MYLNKSPLEKWTLVRQWHKSLAEYIGCCFMESNFKVTLRTCLPAIVIADFSIMILYNTVHYRNTPIKAIMGTPVLGVICPVSCMSLD